MSVERENMIQSLKHYVIPDLRERGFKGSFPHFYRKLPERLDLFMFQFSMYGGCLYVEISKCQPEGHTDTSGKFYPPNKMKVYYVADGSGFHRLRIGAEVEGQFEFNESNTDEVAQMVTSALSEADEWWRNYQDWWKS